MPLDRNNPPRDRAGYRWEWRDGCRCAWCDSFHFGISIVLRSFLMASTALPCVTSSSRGYWPEPATRKSKTGQLTVWPLKIMTPVEI